VLEVFLCDLHASCTRESSQKERVCECDDVVVVDVYVGLEVIDGWGCLCDGSGGCGEQRDGCGFGEPAVGSLGGHGISSFSQCSMRSVLCATVVVCDRCSVRSVSGLGLV